MSDDPKEKRDCDQQIADLHLELERYETELDDLPQTLSDGQPVSVPYRNWEHEQRAQESRAVATRATEVASSHAHVQPAQASTAASERKWERGGLSRLVIRILVRLVYLYLCTLYGNGRTGRARFKHQSSMADLYCNGGVLATKGSRTVSFLNNFTQRRRQVAGRDSGREPSHSQESICSTISGFGSDLPSPCICDCRSNAGLDRTGPE